VSGTLGHLEIAGSYSIRFLFERISISISTSIFSRGIAITLFTEVVIRRGSSGPFLSNRIVAFQISPHTRGTTRLLSITRFMSFSTLLARDSLWCRKRGRRRGRGDMRVKRAG